MCERVSCECGSRAGQIIIKEQVCNICTRTKQEISMAKKLFVGNLPYTITDDQLRDLFSAQGSVESASVIINKQTGRSKGFGFVEMSSDEEAQKAVNELNGKEYEGRPMVVSEARPMQPRTDRFGSNDRGGFRSRREF